MSRYRDERRHKERRRRYENEDDRGGERAERSDYARPFPRDERREHAPRPPREPAARAQPAGPMVEVSCFIRHDRPDNHRIALWNGRARWVNPKKQDGEEEDQFHWVNRNRVEIKHHGGVGSKARSVILIEARLAQEWELDPA